jgi:hypothetical protein
VASIGRSAGVSAALHSARLMVSAGGSGSSCAATTPLKSPEPPTTIGQGLCALDWIVPRTSVRACEHAAPPARFPARRWKRSTDHIEKGPAPRPARAARALRPSIQDRPSHSPDPSGEHTASDAPPRDRNRGRIGRKIACRFVPFRGCMEPRPGGWGRWIASAMPPSACAPGFPECKAATNGGRGTGGSSQPGRAKT